jgi:hypothetical protein
VVVRLWHVQNDAAPAQEIKKSDTLWHGISKGSFRSRIKFYPELKKHWFNLFCNVPYKATQSSIFWSDSGASFLDANAHLW